MANLIQVQNELKNLSDEELQSATQTPAAGTPPFMVLAETQRRQAMRDAYEGERARKQENQTTVAEDLTGMAPGPQGLPGSAPPAAGGMPPAPGGMPPPAGGLPPAGPPPGPPPGMPAFANGGLVDFGGSFQQGLAELSRLQSAQREDMKNMALLNAGLRIMGGTSPDPAQNIALAAPAINEYQEGMQRSIQDQLGLMRAGAEYEQDERAAALQQMQFDFRQREADRQAAVDQRRLEIQQQAAEKPIADVQRYEYRRGLTPEEQQEFDKSYLSTRGLSPEQMDRYMSSAYTAAEKEAYKTVLNDVTMTAKMNTPEGKAEVEAAVQAMARDIFVRRNPQWRDFANRFGGAASSVPPTTPGGVSIINAPPAGATIRPLVDPLVYGGD